jgi:RimJ/RimL family protein N-acetyltransferase
MNNPFLIGAKIYLRPLERSDAAVLAPWFNDQEVVRNTLQFRPLSIGGEELWIENANRNQEITLGIAIRGTDELVGATGLKDLDQRNRHAGFGIVIGRKDLWNKGLGTEATRLIVDWSFATLNMHRLWLHVYEFNVWAIRIYERIGFVREGLLREDCYRDGKYWNTVLMAMLRSDWERSRAAALAN